jgi:hypothetical protein
MQRAKTGVWGWRGVSTLFLGKSFKNLSIKVGANGFSLPRKIKTQTKHGYDSENKSSVTTPLIFNLFGSMF